MSVLLYLFILACGHASSNDMRVVWDQLVQCFQALLTSVLLDESHAHDDSYSHCYTDGVLVIAHDRRNGCACQEEQDEGLLELLDEAQP
jgi:hypothetical protein